MIDLNNTLAHKDMYYPMTVERNWNNEGKRDIVIKLFSEILKGGVSFTCKSYVIKALSCLCKNDMIPSENIS